MSSHRSKTRRKARAWQAATLVLAAGSVGLLALPIATMIRPAAASWDDGAATAPNNNQGAYQPSLGSVDAQNVGQMLALLSPKPTEPPVDEPEPPDSVPPMPPEDVAVTSGQAQHTGPKANWIFLGSAVTPRASRALVRIDQSQKFIRQGAEVGGVKLVAIHDDHIVIEENKMERRIDRAAMVADAMLAPPKTPTATAAKGAAQTPPALTPPPGNNAAALAAAQAAHGKTKGSGATTSGRSVARIMQLPPELRQQVYLTMTSTTATYEERIRTISELGFDPDAGLDERREAVRALGLDPENPEVLRILEDEMNGAARDQR